MAASIYFCPFNLLRNKTGADGWPAVQVIKFRHLAAAIPGGRTSNRDLRLTLTLKRFHCEDVKNVNV